MENLRPLLSVNLVPVISHLFSNLLYDIIKVMKSKKKCRCVYRLAGWQKKQKKCGIEFAMFPKSHEKFKTTSEC